MLSAGLGDPAARGRAGFGACRRHGQERVHEAPVSGGSRVPSPASPQQGTARGLAGAARPPYPRRPAGCAPSPRSAAGGDARWCAGSSTRLQGEGPGAVSRGPSAGPPSPAQPPQALCTCALRGSVPHGQPPHGRQSHLNQRHSAPRDGAESQPNTNGVRPPSRHGARQRSAGRSRAGVGRGSWTPEEPQHSPHGARHSRSHQPSSSSTRGSPGPRSPRHAACHP